MDPSTLQHIRIEALRTGGSAAEAVAKGLSTLLLPEDQKFTPLVLAVISKIAEVSAEAAAKLGHPGESTMMEPDTTLYTEIRKSLCFEDSAVAEAFWLATYSAAWWLGTCCYCAAFLRACRVARLLIQHVCESLPEANLENPVLYYLAGDFVSLWSLKSADGQWEARRDQSGAIELWFHGQKIEKGEQK